MRQIQRENIQVALTLLLGPETDYALRVRAARKLARHGPGILPLVLITLSNYPEITAPEWPWWPPQYEHCSRLLLHLCQRAQINLEDALYHPALSHEAGPVLWISVLEATSLLPHNDYEVLLCQGLQAHWKTVRYVAAMALASRARKGILLPSTLKMLHQHQTANETFPVRLTCSYALLNSGKPAGLEVLMQLMEPDLPTEVRKAATFILSTELPFHLSSIQCEQLTGYLLHALCDIDNELALQAGHALTYVASPTILPTLSQLLTQVPTQTQIVVLTVLEELAKHKTMRHHIRYLAMPTRLLPFLKSNSTGLRRQASYTLAACGGEYVEAVLGTIVLNKDHPGHLEAIESLRFLHGVLRAPLRDNVIRWLFCALSQSQEEVKATALDSLAYLLWQARTQRQKQAWHTISQEIIRYDTVLSLLNDESAWVRQRAIELLVILDSYLHSIPTLPTYLRHLLHGDHDSGVRACAAYACGQLAARWSIPALIQALLDPDEHVAQTALTALGQVSTIDDVIVVYVVIELTHYLHSNDPTTHELGKEAQKFVKKLQKAERSNMQKRSQTVR